MELGDHIKISTEKAVGRWEFFLNQDPSLFNKFLSLQDSWSPKSRTALCNIQEVIQKVKWSNNYTVILLYMYNLGCRSRI